MTSDLFLLYLAGVGLAITGTVVFIFWKIAHRHGMISRSLGLRLLAIRFGQYRETGQEPNIQQIREKIALMEQFYSHLHSLRSNSWHRLIYGKPTFALELTVPHVGEELSFYIAIPRMLVPSLEKMVQGIFPEAHVEAGGDYNIFNPRGATAGTNLLGKRNRYYPIKNYQKLEGDPMRAITNVFTKLAHEGEGAALQIVATPAARRWGWKFKRHARLIFEGKRPREGVVGHAVGIIEGVMKKESQMPDPAMQSGMMKRITPLEEEMVKALEQKASKPLFEANVRILASAPTQARAQEIVQGIEVAFAQFDDPNLNSFNPIRAAGSSLKRIAFSFSFRTFEERKKIILASDELTSIFHFPNIPLETPKISQVKAHDAVAPANVPREGLLLGFNLFREQKRDIYLLNEDRRRHLYMVGQTGTGKSVFLENMIVQDIEAGRGLCVIDPHGDMVERLLSLVPRHRAQDVIYFNPGDIERPLGLNMLEYDPAFPEQKTFIVNELFKIFQQLYGAVPESLGPMFEQYFRNATMLVMDDPSSGNTLLEVARVMSEKPLRELKIARAKNPVVKSFWTEVAEKAGGEAELKNMVPYITSKIDNFIANEIMRPIIAQEKSAFNFREAMDANRILLVNLSKGRLGELNSSLLGLIIVGKILMAALGRVDISEERRRDFYLYIDEFQNVTTDSIATILSEARKYRLDLTITHQFIGQLKEDIKKAVFGNVGSMVSFRIGSDDAEFVAKQFKPVFNEQDLLNIENRNCYVKLLVNGAVATPFSMKTYPPPKGDPEVAALIKQISRMRYGRPKEEIDSEIAARYGTM